MERELTVDLPLDDLWDAVRRPEGLGGWLGDEVDLDEVRPGAAGRVLDDGTWRRLVITGVDERVDGTGDDRVAAEPERRVSFVWWPEDDADAVSRVELVVLPTAAGSRLRVIETFAALRATSAARWHRLDTQLSLRCAASR